MRKKILFIVLFVGICSIAATPIYSTAVNQALKNMIDVSTGKFNRIDFSSGASFSPQDVTATNIRSTGEGSVKLIRSPMAEVWMQNNTKAIVLDATGEYSKISHMEHCLLPDTSYFHYSRLTIDDIFLLLRPSGQVQAPKLMEAIRSLKIVKLMSGVCVNGIVIENGCIKKESQKKYVFHKFYSDNITKIETNTLDIDISHLVQQVAYECIYEDGNFGKDPSVWGGRSDKDYGNCSSLFGRIANLVNASHFKDIFGFSKNASGDLTKKIDEYIDQKSNTILRIGFEKVGYDFQGREILANAIAKNLLLKARNGKFKQKPLIVFVDEAHQYLNKSIRDEYFMAKPLDAFDQIAKECRKYGLFLCLSTQMPRDIPIGTLSQMGTFIVHRLINHFDKEAIANACSSANKNILSFLPVLGEGEAILTGVDFPMPLSIKITPPRQEPNSATPLFKKEKG